jgi:hypothetical protein
MLDRLAGSLLLLREPGQLALDRPCSRKSLAVEPLEAAVRCVEDEAAGDANCYPYCPSLEFN